MWLLVVEVALSDHDSQSSYIRSRLEEPCREQIFRHGLQRSMDPQPADRLDGNEAHEELEKMDLCLLLDGLPRNSRCQCP